MRKQPKIIGARFRYIGDWHPDLRGQEVEVIQILRGPSPDEYRILCQDHEIGSLAASDIVEFAPMIREKDGRIRRSFVTSDCRPDQLEPLDS